MLVVDAYNVLHTTGVLPPHLAGIDVGGLAELVATSRYGSRRAVLVCDGIRPGPALPAAHAEIVYAGPGREADDLIETMLKGHGRSVTVVSNDHRLRRSARRARGTWLACESFLRQLVADHERATAPGSRSRNKDRPAFATAIPLETDVIRSWLREFGIAPTDPILRLTGAAGLAVDSDPLPPSAAPRQPVRRDPTAARAKPPTTGATGKGTAADAGCDPIIREALKEWAGRLSVDDLDMSKWLKD